MRYVITHGHIFKNAGTTFDTALKNAFGKGFYDHRDDKAMRQGGANYLEKFILDNPQLKAISSHHLCNPLPVSEDFTCIPVYFLRNPIERIISVYNFERKQKKGTKGAEMASKLSLVDYVKWRMTPESPKTIFNYQTQYLGSHRNLHPHEFADLPMFTRALKLFSQEDTYIGSVENFDESFKYITKKLTNYFPDVNFEFEMSNVSNPISTEKKYELALAELSKILPMVIDNNAYDLVLHQLAISGNK